MNYYVENKRVDWVSIFLTGVGTGIIIAATVLYILGGHL